MRNNDSTMGTLVLALLSFLLATTAFAVEGQQEPPPQQQSSPSSIDANFAKVAALGQEIALAKKEAEALQMRKSLDALKASQVGQKTLGFKVLRIEGFDTTLYAELISTNGAIQKVGPGEEINDSYRVSLITATSVKVLDISSNKVFPVPFYTGVSSDSFSGQPGGNSANASGNLPSEEGRA